MFKNSIPEERAKVELPTLAFELRMFRIERGWSMGQMAKYLGISRKTYINWEYGVNRPRMSGIRLIQNRLLKS